MKFVGIGGEPEAGRTLLMASLAEILGEREPDGASWFSFGFMPGLRFHAANAFILGTYGDKEQGFDALPAGVRKDAHRFLELQSAHLPTATLLFEGDALFDGAFLDLCASHSQRELFLWLETPNCARKRQPPRPSLARVERNVIARPSDLDRVADRILSFLGR